MDYKVNERFFERVLDIKKETDNLTDEQAGQYLISRVRSDEDIITGIFSGYLHAMERGAEIAKVEIDMTYDTLPDIMRAITALAYLQNAQDYNDKENAELTMKTLATYLTLMAVNNHGAKIEVNKKGYKRGMEIPDLWSNRYYLRINHKRNSDLLPPAIEGVNAAQIEIEHGFAVDMNPLIGVYMRVTGVNLVDYGFANLIINFDAENLDVE